jgi:hypothetical protein
MRDRRSFLRGAVLLGVGVGVGGVRLSAASAAPSIIGCNTWGARPASSSLTMLSTRPDKIIVHHTFTPNRNDLGLSRAYSLCRGIQNHHMDTNGWSDTGQHFTVTRDGYMLEGRHRSLEGLNAGTKMVSAAHCPGQNDKAIGIENEGDYMSATPPAALWESLVDLSVQICSRYGIAASSISGHRDFVSTNCPGDVLYAKLGQLRTAVARELAASGLRSWPTQQSGSSGDRVRAVQYLLRQAGSTTGVDGAFGSGTRAAVVAFQTARGLTADGVVGAATWEALVAQLRQGSSGEAVRGLQTLLTARGYATGVDGAFGSGTRTKVVSYQGGHSIHPDGIVGADTWYRLVIG